MRVFLLKDLPNVGKAGEIVKVSDGYAANFLFPRKSAVEVTRDNEESLKARVIERERKKEVVATQTSQLAERIKSTEIVIKRKIHDDNKLYGSVGQTDIVELLAEKGIKVSKSQVLIDKSIRTRGTHTVTIKLTARLTPQLTVRVISEAA
jgi:large subunit ribosomal protein L9